MNISCARQRNFNYYYKECNDRVWRGGRDRDRRGREREGGVGRLGDQWNGVPLSAGGKKFFLSQKCLYQLWDPTKFTSNGYRGCSSPDGQAAGT